MQMITVLVAGKTRASLDQCVRSLRGEPGIRVIGEARNITELLAAVEREPRIIVLDVEELGHNTDFLLSFVDPRHTKVILVTRRPVLSKIPDALFHGARGYLERAAVRTLLSKAIRRVDAGEAWVPRRVVPEIVERVARLSAQV